MEDQWIHQYIPAGSLSLTIEKNSIAPELSVLPELAGWRYFTRRHDKAPISSLPYNTQQALITQPVLKPFSSIWHNRWIQLSFTTITHSDSQINGRVRVYILPQDVSGSVQTLRSNPHRLLSLLLSQLDYSQDSWNGESSPIHLGLPVPKGGGTLSEEHDASLLTVFNNVPSPNPKPDMVVDPDAKYKMQCLLEGQVPGLLTSLYPYQGRSVALMLQREVEPGRIIDPRFRCVTDQAGIPWYYDSVSGVVLREPRYYDGSRGGILAEEMGTGKTLMCLALILSTKNEPTGPPEPFVAETPPRTKMASLMDMAAAAANKHSVAWKPYFEACAAQLGFEYQNCIRALTRPENRARYEVKNPLIEPRRSGRTAPLDVAPKEVYLSYTNLIIVPNNLVKQWQNEIKKHTTGLNVLVLVDKNPILPVTELLAYDIILFSEGRFEWIQKERSHGREIAIDTYCPLEYIHFKRCIVDEGHKLGNRSRGWKSDVMRVLDKLHISARWVVTGTPSRGLYGVEKAVEATDIDDQGNTQQLSDSRMRQEREDIQRIGNLAAKYLKVRPWANSKDEAGDTVAEWNVYVMHPSQHANGHNRKDCLTTTLNSLIIRHQLSDVSTMLPPVDEKIVVLDGSYQDRLSLNLFSMMIIFNSVQSQRTDMDYFFHERQKKSLFQLVKNLKQASFFGGVFYSTKDIAKALETAEGFVEKKEIPISAEDEALLRKAIDFGKLAVTNRLKDVSNQFHAMPLYVKDFPGGNGKSWSLDDRDTQGGPVLTDAGLIHALQKFLNPCIDAPSSLKLMIDSGHLDQQGNAERSQALSAAMDASGEPTTSQNPQATALAGNTPLGDDHHAKPKSGTLNKNADPVVVNEDDQPRPELPTKIEIAEPLAKTQIISTVSAKLSYLIDCIVKYQDEEQIIIFYENDNVAYYLASVLEILQIQHLIYARSGLSAARRAQYVATFTHNPAFRVLLMDISQAAFGLDMRSASRIYFTTPVLNLQVQAQAVGRARRVSQQKPVTVETLVLRHSIEELVVSRREHMSPAEHCRVRNWLDDRQMYEWILNARIVDMPEGVEDGVAQTAMLEVPQFVFGRGFGRELRNPDEGLLVGEGSPEEKGKGKGKGKGMEGWKDKDRPAAVKARANKNRGGGLKRPLSPSPAGRAAEEGEGSGKRKRARVTWAD
ncbi:SNF2 family N-terminal domain-containing protein [Biscogniauxia mediterranea]|nr:SNF2 family N-terminal domain-containing protein [Biscogniauxia mediterranea]